MRKHKMVSRRDFLKIIAITGIAGFTAKYGLDALNAPNIASETRMLMGTVINIEAFGPDPKFSLAAINACFSRMATLEGILSRFHPKSQVSRLNQASVLHDAHSALISLIQQSQELSELTDGAFDITVKPLLDLYQARLGGLPDARQIRQSLPLVDYRKIRLSGQQIAFQQSGMSITLDGIAKGYIVDEGVAVLKEFGFANVLVEAGGDLMALGEKAPNSPWKIGLQAPRTELGNQVAVFKINDKALATSGDYIQTFTPDFANHHIIDPRSGHSSSEFASVTVCAPSVAQADGLATAIMVMGMSGLELIEQLSGYEAYVLTKDATVIKTSGFQEN